MLDLSAEDGLQQLELSLEHIRTNCKKTNIFIVGVEQSNGNRVVGKDEVKTVM